MVKIAFKNPPKSLPILVIIALLLGIYFLKNYVVLIALSAILAFLFNPLYKKLLKRTNDRAGLSAGLTFVAVVLIIAIPVTLLLVITIDQALQVAESFKTSAAGSNSLYDTLVSLIADINKQLDKVPGLGSDTIRISQLTDWLRDNASNLTHSAISLLSGFAGGFSSLVTGVVIFIFVFLSMLKKQDEILMTIKRLNPLGVKSTEHYLEKMGAMTSAMVKGQFMIAIAQGFVDALLLEIVGFDFFILWFVLLTFLSIIPLGGGIIVLPLGALLVLTGHIWQGLILIIGHILIVTNIDNVLRPRFVPKSARLDSALLMLSVFAGLGFFGFPGIVMGPVIMIIIVTTVQIYLEAQKPGSTAINKK